VRRTEEIEVTPVGAAVVATGQGYVELRRRFRAIGVDDEQRQRILITARLDNGRWRVAEVWVQVSGGGSGTGNGGGNGRGQSAAKAVGPGHCHSHAPCHSPLALTLTQG